MIQVGGRTAVKVPLCRQTLCLRDATVLITVKSQSIEVPSCPRHSAGMIINLQGQGSLSLTPIRQRRH